MSTCGDCISIEGGCCKSVFAAGRKLVLLPSEVRRISASTGKSPAEFADRSPLTTDQLASYVSKCATDDPLWSRLFALWKRPSGITSACPFLTANGCSIPCDYKPFLCQVYPLSFSITHNLIYFSRDAECVMQLGMESTQDVLQFFHDSMDRLRQSYQTFRQECLNLLDTLENLSIRPMIASDRKPLIDILVRTSEFLPAEVSIAEEVIDCYLERGIASGYHVCVALVRQDTAGYICFGPTPLTEATWDIYWLATAPEYKGNNLGGNLMAFAEQEIDGLAGELLIIETSSKPEYEKTRQFHLGLGYNVVGRIQNFYAHGDDKLILAKRLR